MGLAEFCKESLWLRTLLREVGYAQASATVLHEDNQGAMSVAEHDKHHGRTKHIDVRYHFTRECVETGQVVLKYCETREMIADVLTKALTPERHRYLTNKMLS
jgi:hypothetical protein